MSVLRSLAFNTCYALKVHSILRNLKEREGLVSCICFHRVSNDIDHFWPPLTPDAFRAILTYLTKYYRIVSFHEAVNDPWGSKPMAVLSFDDGYYDFYENALPILKEFNVPANHNIVTDIAAGRMKIIWTQKLNIIFNHLKNKRISASLDYGSGITKVMDGNISFDSVYLEVIRNLFLKNAPERDAILEEWVKRFEVPVETLRMMGWKEIADCVKNGIDIGSHTKRHSVLTSITNKEELDQELIDSKSELENELKIKVESLAPPNGQLDDALIKKAVDCGYKYVLGIGEPYFLPSEVKRTNFVSRLNLVPENYKEMVLRVEGLHAVIKNNGRL